MPLVIYSRCNVLPGITTMQVRTATWKRILPLWSCDGVEKAANFTFDFNINVNA